MASAFDPFDADPRPVRLAGESLQAWEDRLKAWTRRRSQGVTDLARPGIPAPTLRYAPSATGERLGDFVLRPAAGLPPPVRVASPDAATGTEDAFAAQDVQAAPEPSVPSTWPMGLPSQGVPPVTPLWAGPGGALPPGLRTPFDEPEAARRRRERLAATGFDTDWGEPPQVPGLAWDAGRALYVPTLDEAGSAYQGPADRGWFRQPYKDVSLPYGQWGWRWVDAWAAPYRILAPGEAAVAQLAVDRRRVDLRSPLAALRRGEVSIEEAFGPVAPIRPIAQAPPRPVDMTRFAWVPQYQLPAGCPYPYPYLPVPREDYVSGRWLSPDYTPSIPLPPPYDQTPWRCGVPAFEPQKKKGGAGLPPSSPAGHWGTADPLSRGDGGATASVSLDVGIPPPGGNLVLASVAAAPGPAAAPAATPQTGPFPSGLRIPCGEDHAKKYMPASDASASPDRGEKGGAFRRALKSSRSKNQRVERKCKEARDKFVQELNQTLRRLNLSLELVPPPKGRDEFYVLFDTERRTQADPAEFTGPAGDFVQLVNNGNLGTAANPATHEDGTPKSAEEVKLGSDVPLNPSGDPRLQPTTIYLVNRNFSYDDPSTGDRAHVGVTPAQDGADGNVYVNVDARNAYQSLAKSAPLLKDQDAFNLVVQVFHEMSEHLEGAKVWKDYVSRPLGDARSGRTAPTPSPREAGKEPPDLEALANPAAKRSSTKLATNWDLPRRAAKDWIAEDDSGHAKYFFPDEPQSHLEMPAALRVVLDFPFGKDTKPYTVEVKMDAQGVPIAPPTAAPLGQNK